MWCARCAFELERTGDYISTRTDDLRVQAIHPLPTPEHLLAELPATPRTFNAGGGVKYFATDKLVIRLDTRYRYLDSLTNRHARSLDTYEATIGIGWRF